MHYKIKDLPVEERPYEKFIKYGPKSLSDSELIGIILKNGTKNISSIDLAREILKMPDGSQNLTAICSKTFEDLRKFPGIGLVKAISIKCIAEISERIARTSFSTDLIIDEPSVVSSMYMEKLRHLKSEQFIALYLNTAGSLITDCVISSGTVNCSIVSARDVFMKALSYEAVKMIFIHNHPSGNPTPSNADIELTNKLVKAGEILDIKVIDHIIIGDLKYISFKECGLM